MVQVYESILDSRATHLSASMAYQAGSSKSTAGVGRPHFDLSKEQLEYVYHHLGLIYLDHLIAPKKGF